MGSGVILMPHEITPGSLMHRQLEMRAARADAQAAFDLGLIWSSGSGGFAVDLKQAHKWFNLAALWGSEEAVAWRQEVSEEMTAREVVDAQRAARAVLLAIQPTLARAA